MAEEDRACPLCLELMDADDLEFFPCKCNYQICCFCWHRIRMEDNGLCPACREAYTDQPDAVFKSMANRSIDYRSNNQKKKRKDASKNKSTEIMKYLPELRVVQPNLIFVIGLPLWMSKERDQLISSQYFGKFGKVYKVEINQNQTFNGPQGSSSISAYVTYHRQEDAMRAISELDQSNLHGRQLRVSLGTTKYCSQFLKGAKCTKHECMYLHELGDPEASFTKEQMQNGKHTDYMNKLLREFAQNNEIYHSENHIAFETKEPVVNQSNNNNAFEIDTQQQKFSYPSDQSDHSSPHISEFKNSNSAYERSNGTPAPPAKNLANSQSQKKQKTPSSTRKQAANGNSKHNHASDKESNSAKDNGPQHHQFVFGQPQNYDEEPVDIDFDPFSISQNGLAELLAAEEDRFSRLNLSTTSTNQDWQNGSIRGEDGRQMRSFHLSQGPTSTPQRPTLNNGPSANSNSNGVDQTPNNSRVMVAPPGFEEKSLPGEPNKHPTTSHPPGLAHIPDHNEHVINSLMEVSKNYLVNNHSSKITPATNGLSPLPSDSMPMGSLVKALDFACIAFRIAVTLDNPDNDEKIGLDLNTFLVHLAENTGIDLMRLQSAITKSSKMSCILGGSVNSMIPPSSNHLQYSNGIGANLFQQHLGRSNEDLMRHNSLWSSPNNRERSMMQSDSRIGGNSSKCNPASLLHTSHHPSAVGTTLSGSMIVNNINNNSTNANNNPSANPNGSLFSQNQHPMDTIHSKHSQNTNPSSASNNWHIDDPAIVSTRFTMDSSENNIRSCLWQPSNQASFMNPQSSSLVRQMTLSNNQSSTWSHLNLTHQSQPNQQTSDNSDSLDKKPQSSSTTTAVPPLSSSQQSIFHHDSDQKQSQPHLSAAAPGSRHLHNVINNYSVS